MKQGTSLIRKFGLRLVSLVAWLLAALGALWAFGALWFDFPWVELRPLVAGVFVAGLLLVAVFLRPGWRAKLVIAVATGLVAGWWLTLQPRQFRDWQAPVAVTPRAEIDGDRVTLYQVRDFSYRTVGDFTPGYTMRELDLANLRAVDLFITCWGSPLMAHPIASFDFGEQGRVCFSIETRMEKGESYSALGGLYRRFELACVVAEERDVVRLRTSFREGEDVYLYRMKVARARDLFLEYVRTVNGLHEKPRWYNAVANNCTTAIRHQRPAEGRDPWDWRMLANGYADEMLYERGRLDGSLPFSKLKVISRINGRANEVDQAEGFSDRIRVGLPGMD